SAISHQPSAISHQPSATSHQPQAISQRPAAISALLYLFHAHNLRGCVELSVILVGDVLVYVEVLHERESYVDVYRNVPRQPDFIVDPRGIDDDPRPLVDARQKQAERDGVDALRIQFHPLIFGAIDPDSKTKLGQNFRFFALRLETG